MAEKGFMAPELLVDTDWLAAHLGDQDVRIVDMDPPAAHAKGHIPGAVSVGTNPNVKGGADPKLVATPEEVKALFETLGIGDSTRVVAYDNNRSNHAARLWWVLTYYGHHDVAVLDGGWVKWTRERRPIEVTSPVAGHQGQYPRRSFGHTTFTPRPQPRVLSTVESLRAAVGREDTAVWDVRTLEEHTGASDRGNKRRGHVPGAVHLEWTRLVNERDHTFKTADELGLLLAGAGVTLDKAVHTY